MKRRSRSDEDHDHRWRSVSRRSGPRRATATAEAFRPWRLMPAWLLHQRFVLRAEPGCPGRGAEAAERHVPVGLDFEPRSAFPAAADRRRVARPNRGNMRRVQTCSSSHLAEGPRCGPLRTRVGRRMMSPMCHERTSTSPATLRLLKKTGF